MGREGDAGDPRRAEDGVLHGEPPQHRGHLETPGPGRPEHEAPLVGLGPAGLRHSRRGLAPQRLARRRDQRRRAHCVAKDCMGLGGEMNG